MTINVSPSACRNGHFAPRSSRGRCKECERLALQRYRHTDKYRAKNREVQRQRRLEGKCREEYRRNPKARWLSSARARATRQGVPFDLKPEDILIPEKCPVFGYQLNIGSKAKADNSPSLDRLTPRKGYVRGNISVISFRANRLKGDGTAKELRKIANWMDTHAV